MPYRDPRIAADARARALVALDHDEALEPPEPSRDGGQTCILELTCPSFEQRSTVTSCSLDPSALRADTARLLVDLRARRVVSRDPLGAIELRLDPP